MFRVTNRNGFEFVGRYNGLDYEFKPGVSTLCPDDAAQHIFAMGEHDKSAMFARNAWVKPAGDYEEGVGILRNFDFVHVEPVYVTDDEYGPAPVSGEAFDKAGLADEKPAASKAKTGPSVGTGKPRGRPKGSGMKKPPAPIAEFPPVDSSMAVA